MLRRTGRRGSLSGSEPENPMDGLTNLSDVMLVFSCGLLLALILNYNINVSEMPKTEVEYDYEIEMAGEGEDSQKMEDDSGFQQLGTVYVDPKTGKMYVVDTVPEDAAGESTENHESN